MNDIAYRGDIEQVLVPTLTPGDIVVMDNFLTSAAVGIRIAIEEARAKSRYRALCTPDERHLR